MKEKRKKKETLTSSFSLNFSSKSKSKSKSKKNQKNSKPKTTGGNAGSIWQNACKKISLQDNVFVNNTVSFVN